MTPKSDCPLTPALLKLLQACVDIPSLYSKRLARALHRAPTTIDTEFQRIIDRLGLHARFEAVIFAMKQGWVELPIDSSIPPDKRRVK